MESRVVVIDTEPYCIWEHDINEKNQKFLEGIDTEYFEYLLEKHFIPTQDQDVSKMDQIRASVALRSALHQSMEMMFSLLGSLLQSPTCTYVWMIQCKNSQLYNVINKINAHDSELHHELIIDNTSWESLAKIVFSGVINDNPSSLFAKFWGDLANEYCDENKTKEYNSIKHGLRIKSGGFSFSLGIEKEHGKPTPAEAMHLLHASKYGSSFIKLEPCNSERPNRSIVSKQVSLSWEMDNIVAQLQLIIMSIKNITLHLKMFNGCKTEESLVTPKNVEMFKDAWKSVPSINNLEMQTRNNGNQPTTKTKQELLKLLEIRKTK